MADFGWKNDLINTRPPGSTAVSTDISLNPWGRGNDDPHKSRNLHRTDLWYVDFSSVYKSLVSRFGRTGQLTPVYCRSITLPETRVKPEPFKRDGIPFNMPGCDEPLDAISMVLWMESVSPNPVLEFLSDWLSLVRAGRGERYSNGFADGANEVTLADGSGGAVPFGVEFSFPFTVWLLQGATANTPATQMIASGKAFLGAFTNTLATQNAQSGGFGAFNTLAAASAGVTAANKVSAPVAYCQLEKVTGFETKGWLGSFKLADLTYEGSQILTVEAKVYPEYVVQTV